MSQPHDKRERRYERLRPTEISAIRKQFPVAYLPLGTLEWHGLHDPVGLDGLKAAALAARCADEAGGLVFPTLYYGENREGELIEMFPEYQDKIAEELGISADLFSPGYMGRSILAQVNSYRDLIFHTLCEITSLGFEAIVPIAGHYPLKAHAESASKIFYQFCCRSRELKKIPVVWTFSDYDLVEDLYPGAADHAGFWETSLLMALEPGLVDLSTLPPDESELVGVLKSNRPVKESNADFGEEAVNRILDRAVSGVRERLAQPEKFYPR